MACRADGTTAGAKLSLGGPLAIRRRHGGARVLPRGRRTLPHAAADKRLVGFHDGGWIAAMSAAAGGGDTLVTVNLFSAKQRTTP